MKNSWKIWLSITSLILVLLVVLVFFNAQFPIVFYLTCLGQGLLIYTVYKILTDSSYKSDKKFKDWYADSPRKHKLPQ